MNALLAVFLAVTAVTSTEKGNLHDDDQVVTAVDESKLVHWGEDAVGKSFRVTGGYGSGASSTGGVELVGSTLKVAGSAVYPGIIDMSPVAGGTSVGAFQRFGSGAGLYFYGTDDMYLPGHYGLGAGWESLDQRIRRLAPMLSETDPVFTIWSQTNTLVKSETDPKFTRWTETNTFVKAESDPVFAGWIGDELGGTNVFRAKTDLVVYDGTPQSPTADRLATVSGVKGLIAGATNSFPTADGDMRMLPAYLHYAEFCDSYTNDAAWYYEHADAGDFGCSARRSGNVLERNFDWTFDSAPSFVVRMTAGPGRFASVGVAHVGTNVTEAFVTSHKWSRFYRCLPGRTMDGVNEKGVACEINVLPASGAEWETKGTRTLNSSGAVRWVLDHASSAAQAAAYLKDNVYVAPATLAKGFSVHFMVSDPDETWIVEDGEAHEVGLSAVMTNFGLFREGTSGEGYERWTNLVGGASIESQWWTKAYEQATDPVRASDLGTADPDEQLEIFSAWLTGDRESHRGQTAGGKTWWQTVHTSVYDVSNRVLKVCVQENPEWYVFSPPASGDGDVESVNGMKGAVVLDAAAVHALPDDYTPPVTSVNGETGAVTLDYEDVGAWDSRHEVAAARALGYYGRSWIGGTAPYSLTWDTTEKRFKAQWTVGEIPVSGLVAYLSDLDGFVPSTRTINGQALTEDVTIDTGISADQARTISEGVRTSHPYLEVGAGGGIYVVIPEDE